MLLTDFSPPEHPTRDQQWDALCKGLGRAAIWARSGRLDPALLLNACLHDLRYDSQSEENRGSWLWGMLRTMELVDSFRAPILDGLKTAAGDATARQFCELASCYAVAGDAVFLQELHEFVGRRLDSEDPYIGLGQLLRACGTEGLRFVLQRLGKLLIQHEWQGREDFLVEEAIRLLGNDAVESILRTSDDPDMQRFVDHYERNADQRSTCRAPLRPAGDVTVDDIRREAEQKNPVISFTAWGDIASENDLRLILDHLWQQTNPVVIQNLLQLLRRRALPCFDPRLIDLCRHPDELVQCRAITALAMNQHPLIREFAFERLQDDEPSQSYMPLCLRNYEPGDEHRILELLRLPDEDHVRHDILSDLNHVLERHPTADAEQLALISYFHTPCQYCRYYAARLLLTQRVAPQWLLDECRHDAGEETRHLETEWDQSVLTT